MTREGLSCTRSAARRKRGARSEVEWTSSLRRAGRPGGTCGVAWQRSRWSQQLWTRWDRCRSLRRVGLATLEESRPCSPSARRPPCGHPVPLGRRDADPRGIPASPDGRAETDAEWYPNLYEVGWPDAPHRAIHNSTAERWEAAGRPAPGSRPGEGEVIAHFASGEPILRYSPRPRWSERPVRSRRYHCGPDRALRSPNSHSPLRKSWPSSSRACSPPHRSFREWPGQDSNLRATDDEGVFCPAIPAHSDSLLRWSRGYQALTTSRCTRFTAAGPPVGDRLRIWKTIPHRPPAERSIRRTRSPPRGRTSVPATRRPVAVITF